jgi:hypothetical protein
MGETNPGHEFEKRIKKDALYQRVSCTEVPNKFVNVYSGNPIQISTPYDFALGIDGKSCFLDAKASGKDNFNYKSYVLSEEKIHQYHALLKDFGFKSFAGYLIHFYKLHQIVWLPVDVIDDHIKTGISGCAPGDPRCPSQSDEIPINFRTLIVR